MTEAYLFRWRNAPAVALAANGVLTALTGPFGYCPACAMVGRKLPQDGPR